MCDQLEGLGRQVLCRYMGSHSSLGLCCVSEIAEKVEIASLKNGCFSCCSHCKIHKYFVFLKEGYFLPKNGELSWILDAPLSCNTVGHRERLVSPCTWHSAAQQSGSWEQCTPVAFQFVTPCFATGLFWPKCRSPLT